MDDSGGGPPQLHPQPLHFVKQPPGRGLSRRLSSRRPSNALALQRIPSGPARSVPRRVSPAPFVPSSMNTSAVPTVTKRNAYGVETQEVISQKPSDTPLRVRKSRGSRASGSESTTSIPSNSSYASPSSYIPSYTDEKLEALPRKKSSHLLPSSSSFSLENFNPSLHSSELDSTSTLGERPFTAAGEQVTARTQTLSSPRATPKRRPSTKRRVLTRMLGGFQAKPRSSPQRNGHSDGSLFRRLSGRSNSSNNLRSKSIATADPSMDTLTSQSSCSLVASPSTPRSGRTALMPTSPLSTPSENRSSNTSFYSRGVLPFMEPELDYPPILNLELKFITWVDRLDCKTEKSIWVAIEGRGAVEEPVTMTRRRLLGLDVVVVIDNSHTTSQQCLDNAHQNVISLTEMLNRPNDRLAVFCTHCQHRGQNANNVTGCTLHPLQAPCVQSLREELHSIRDRPLLPFRQNAPLDETVGAAIRFLSQPISPGREALREGVTHVFVFSAKPTDCLHVIPDFRSFHIHLVNPSVIPFPDRHASRRTWTVPTFLSAMDNWSTLNVDTYEDISERLRQAVLHARNGGTPGKITDIRIKMMPGPGCHLEGVLGQASKAVLRVNQTFSIIARIRVDMALTQGSIPRPSEKSKAKTGLEDAFSDLEKCLGESQASLFTAQAMFHHSVFPASNFIFTEQTCKITKTDSTAPWSLPDTTSSSLRTKKAKVELHKRLAFFIATNSTPKEVLRELDKIFRPNNSLAACPEFVKSVRKELHHQLLVIGYHATATSSSRSPLVNSENHFRCLGRFSFETPDKQQTFALGLELSRIRSASDSPATVIHQRISERITEHTEPDESVDEAAQIWRHMRKDSKSRRRGPNESNESLELIQSTDERLRELRKHAIQNKRSIGADTLRSLSLALTIPTSVETRTAPWL